MKWYEYLIIAVSTSFLVLLILALLQNITSSENKQVLITLKKNENISGLATLKCSSINFQVTQFALTTKTGKASISQADCELIKHS
jgi:hypothetical protein